MTTYKELQEVFNIPKTVVIEAQLKTMPDDIINLVCEFMPSYIKDIKSLQIQKTEKAGYTIDLMKAQKLWFHHQARNCIGMKIYINRQERADYLDNIFDLPLYPLPITPYTSLRMNNQNHRRIEKPFIAKINTGKGWITNGNCVIIPNKTRKNETPTGKEICKNLQDYYCLSQLDLIADFYKIKVPSKIRWGKKIKYIQYLMKQEY